MCQIISWLVCRACGQSRKLKLLNSLKQHGGPQLMDTDLSALLEELLKIC